MDFGELIKGLQVAVEGREGGWKKGKVIIETKKLAAGYKKDYLAAKVLMEEGLKLAEQAERLKDKIEAYQNKWWASVELELDEFRPMTYKPETNEVEIWDDVKKNSIVSPIQNVKGRS